MSDRTDGAPMVTVAGVTRVFPGDVHALAGVDLTVERGETVRVRVQPIARRSPNSRVRSKRDSNMVLPTMTAPISIASTVLPLTAAWRYTRLRSARPNSDAVRMVVSAGCA